MIASEFLTEQFAKAERDEFGHIRITQDLADSIVESVKEVENTYEQLQALAVKLGFKEGEN